MVTTDWKKLADTDALVSPPPRPIAFEVTDAPPPHEAALRDRVQAVIWKVELRRFAYDVRWVLTAPHITPLGVTLIAASIPDRDTGVLADVVVPTLVPPRLLEADDQVIASFLFDLLVAFVRHEAAEAFHLDSVRVFDPHARKEPWTHEGPLRRR